MITLLRPCLQPQEMRTKKIQLLLYSDEHKISTFCALFSALVNIAFVRPFLTFSSLFPLYLSPAHILYRTSTTCLLFVPLSSYIESITPLFPPLPLSASLICSSCTSSCVCVIDCYHDNPWLVSLYPGSTLTMQFSAHQKLSQSSLVTCHMPRFSVFEGQMDLRTYFHAASSLAFESITSYIILICFPLSFQECPLLHLQHPQLSSLQLTNSHYLNIWPGTSLFPFFSTHIAGVGTTSMSPLMCFKDVLKEICEQSWCPQIISHSFQPVSVWKLNAKRETVAFFSR